MSEKIKPHHLERGAFVYVRQSTPYQVRNHLESKDRQYALTERAKQLGFCKLIVIDDDLGRSGSGMQERPGFGKLLTSVCQGLAGAVFALEASRLARNNRDWHHLVDLCALTREVWLGPARTRMCIGSSPAQRHPQRIERRRYIIADPVRYYLCHRTLQRYHRREDHPMIVRQDHCIDIDDIGCCAFARTGNRRHRFEFSNFGKPQLAGRTFEFGLWR